MQRTTASIRLLASALCWLGFGAAPAVAATDFPAKPARTHHAAPIAPIAPSAATALVWSDEFDTTDLDSWTFETGGGGWGNNELQYYTNGQNAFIQYDAMAGSNVLVIEARRGAPAGASCWYGSCQYSSSRMITLDKREFRYGRMEARIRLPQTQGIWPAFWMLGADIGQVGWPQSGEIDIMEHVGSEPTLTHGALHGPGYFGNTPFSGTHDLRHSADAAYHVYAVEWDTNGIRWFVDDQPFYSVTRAQVEARGAWVFDQPFFLLLNVAVGGDWPGSPNAASVFPQRMYVDYVRVYQASGPRLRSVGSQPLAPPRQGAVPAPAQSRPVPVRSTPVPRRELPRRPASLD